MLGKRIGYIHICAKDKNGNKQLHALELDIIFKDTERSKNTEKTQLVAAIRSATIGDQVFIDSIDRLGENKMDTLRHVTEFTSKGASVTLVKEGLVFAEHDEPMSMLIKILLLEFNHPKPISTQKKLRSRSTPDNAKKVIEKRKAVLTQKQVGELKRRADAGENKTALARHFAVNRESLLAYLR